jgi:phage host-nuclease inhibitor protein Gam
MAATKKRKPDAAPIFAGWADVDDALKQIGQLDLVIGKAETRANALKSKADDELAVVADQVNTKKRLEKDMEEYCTAHKDEILPAKSKRLNHGVVGFTASREVSQLKGFTWAAVLQVMLQPVQDALIKLIEKLGKRFVRVKCEVDKAAILAAHNAKQTTDAKLADLGVAVVDKDNFGYTLSDAKAQPTT